MTKKHEELVEEIADYLQAAYAMGQHDYKLGIGYGETPRKWDRDRAKKIITLILAAFRDGGLDEELGVVGRCRAGLGEFASMVTWAHGIWKEGLLTTKHETTTFIALRPLTGTGKGEEKNGDGSGRSD